MIDQTDETRRYSETRSGRGRGAWELGLGREGNGKGRGQGRWSKSIGGSREREREKGTAVADVLIVLRIESQTRSRNRGIGNLGNQVRTPCRDAAGSCRRARTRTLPSSSRSPSPCLSWRAAPLRSHSGSLSPRLKRCAFENLGNHPIRYGRFTKPLDHIRSDGRAQREGGGTRTPTPARRRLPRRTIGEEREKPTAPKGVLCSGGRAERDCASADGPWRHTHWLI